MRVLTTIDKIQIKKSEIGIIGQYLIMMESFVAAINISVRKSKPSLQLTRSSLLHSIKCLISLSLFLLIHLSVSYVLLQRPWKWKRRLLWSIQRLEQFWHHDWLSAIIPQQNDNILDIIFPRSFIWKICSLKKFL